MPRLLASALLISAVAGLAAAPSAPPAARPPEAVREQRAIARLVARGLPVFCAGGRSREVAITFDDGPTALTPSLVVTLRRLQTTATFFDIGASAARLRASTRLQAGIGPVGSHAQTHALLPSMPQTRARWEIAAGRRSVELAIGRPVDLFRPPGGGRTPVLDRIAAAQGMLSVVYTVDPRDWTLASSPAVVQAVERDPRVVPGAIILLHEYRPTTVEAVVPIVRYLRARGLRLVGVPRLLADDPPTLAEQRADVRAGSCVHLFR